MDSGVGSNSYRYNGKELNEELGLNWLDYGARWYDPSIGRWGQVDPIADLATDLTPYRYGFNNPILYIDPFGLFESRREARRERRRQRREARKDGERFKGAKIVKNSDGRFDLRYKGSDGYVTQKENGSLEYGVVASAVENNNNSDPLFPNSIGYPLTGLDVLGANAAYGISNATKNRLWGGNSNIYGNKLTNYQINNLRYNTPFYNFQGKQVTRLNTASKIIGSSAAIVGYANTGYQLSTGQISTPRAITEIGIVSYGWRGGLPGASFGVGYFILGPIVTNTQGYQRFKTEVKGRFSEGGRDGLLTTEY